MVGANRASVDRGEYASASEVVQATLRGWQRQAAEDAERLAIAVHASVALLMIHEPEVADG